MSDPEAGQNGDPNLDGRARTGAIVALVLAGLCLVVSVVWAALR